MKIAIISAGVLPLPPVKGGATENLIDHFMKENEKHQDIEFIIYSIDDAEARKIKNYVRAKFIYINTNTISFKISRAGRYIAKRYFKLNVHNKFIHEVIKDLRNQNYDLLIIENKPEYALPLSKVAKGKIVQHIHNDYLSTPSERNRKILDASSKTIVVSEYIKNTLKWYENQDKIFTLYNGIDTKLFSNDRWKVDANRFRKKLGINNEDIVILYTGRITPQKGIKELIETFRKIKDDKVKLLVVGASWYSKKSKDEFTRNLIKASRDLNDKIIFTGYIDYSQMPMVYASADIAVVPSIGIEAAGLVALEARAAGLPLVISDSGGVPEYVNDSCTLIVERGVEFEVNLLKAIEKIINNSDIRKEMQLNSLVGINSFDKSIYYSNFIKIIRG